MSDNRFPILIAFAAVTLVICFFILSKQEKCDEKYSIGVPSYTKWRGPDAAAGPWKKIPGSSNAPCRAGLCLARNLSPTGSMIITSCVPCDITVN